MNGAFVLHREVLRQLDPKERQVYMELTRLAVFKEEGVVHKEYGVIVPRGSWVISYREMAKLTGQKPSTCQDVLNRLVEKGWVRKTDLGKRKGKDGTHPRTLWSIVDYDKWQQIDLYTDQASAQVSVPQSVPASSQPTMSPDSSPDKSPSLLPDSPPVNPVVRTAVNETDKAVNKKNASGKNDGFKNEGREELSLEGDRSRSSDTSPWLSDEKYQEAIRACDWTIFSHEKIYPLFSAVEKEIGYQEVIKLWREYQSIKREQAYLPEFLIKGYKEIKQAAADDAPPLLGQWGYENF